MAPRLAESQQNRTSIDASVVPSNVTAATNVAAFAGIDDPVNEAVSESVNSVAVPAVSAHASISALPQSPTKLGRVLRIVGPPLVGIWAIIAIVLLIRLFIGTFRCLHLQAGHYKGYLLVGTESRKSFTKNLVLTPEMFEQSSKATPIDLGDIEIETAQP